MSNSWTTERIEQQQPFTGYASDVTNVSASTSQLDLSDTSRPSLTLARNRTSQSGLKRGRSGLRTGSTEEDLVAEQQAEHITLGFRDSDIRQLNMTSQMTNPDRMQTAMPSSTAGFGKAHKVLYDDTTGSISSALQPNSSDTPASQRTSDSESLTRQPFRSEPLSTGEASDHTSPGHPGITRIWNWISSTGRLSASNDEYRLLESGASKVDGDVKTKHANVARRKRTKRSRDVKGRLVEAEPGGMGQKRMWRRLGVAVMTRPYRSLLIFLIALGMFAYSLTKFLMYALNPDKAPLPWRQYCASQQPSYHALSRSPTRRSGMLARISGGFASPSKQPLVEIDSSHPAWPWGPSETRPPHSAEDDSVDQLEPVGIFIGVMTMDRAREKRMLIRQTYGSHPKSRVRGTESVSIRFIMGRPKERYAQEVELENDTFGDIVILDMEENMNSGKTHKYFSWAAEHAMVPEYTFFVPSERAQSPPMNGSEITFRSESETRSQKLDSLDPTAHALYVGEKRPDYVFKADDDALIVLGEMERRLRVAPRKLTFFGYLVKNSFMAGECYGMSLDLVRYIADYEPLRKMVKGKEDKLATKWIKMHPQREDIVWVSERCAIYDHPKAGTVYSHGFLFPNTIDEVRAEDIEQMTPLELQWRGGKHWAATYSTVSHFGAPYTPPFEHMTALQQVEALVEGSEMSLFSRLHAAKHPHAQSVPLWKTDADEAALAMKTYERRPSRQARFRNDPKERGGTMVVHFIKHESWFLEAALALLGPHNSTEL